MNDLTSLLAAALPFWPELTGEEQRTLSEGGVPTRLPRGTVAHRGESCQGLLLIRRGQLRVYVVSEEGREVTLYRVRTGDVCVMSSSCLMDAIVFDVLMEAMEDTEAVTIPTSVLAPVIRRLPQAELFLYKTAAERFSDVMWTLQQILFLGADRRVAIFLRDESLRGGPVIARTHEEIARLIGSAREVVTKVLNYFAQEEIVALERGRITVLDPERLRRLAQG